MILSKRVSLGGVQLDELHERVVVLGIDPGTPNESVQTISRMGGSGQRVTLQHWEKLEITVTYGIDVPKTNMILRRQIFDMVNAWALKKGWLRVNWMPGKRVYIDKVTVPTSGDLWEWTNNYTISFTAYNVPFWQDENPTQTMRNLFTSGNVDIQVAGVVQTVLDVDFRNRSGMTINNFTINAGRGSLYLTGINLGGSATLSINHGTDGILRITAGGVSVLPKRTGLDDLYVEPGNLRVMVSADRAGDLTIRNYGRYV